MSSENDLDSIDEAKKLEQYNDYNYLHDQPPIGDATMDDDGTIRVRIRTMGGMDVTGEIEYSKESEHYDSVLKHLGGLKPGELKLVPPWPDDDLDDNTI